jgi:hypothetical protein
MPERRCGRGPSQLVSARRPSIQTAHMTSVGDLAGWRAVVTQLAAAVRARGASSLLRGIGVLGMTLVACTPIEDFRRNNSLSVYVDADEQVRAEVGDVELVVESRHPDANSWTLETAQRFTAGTPWPLAFRLDSYDPAATYEVRATSRDDAGGVAIQVRAMTDTNLPVPREVRLRFDSECLGRRMLCARDMTCSLGECIDARAPLRERTDAGSEPRVQTGVSDSDAPSIPCETLGKDGRFCGSDGLIYQCQDTERAIASPCTDTETCVEEDGEVKCGCLPGLTNTNGVCSEALDCQDNGGCDALTVCQPDTGKRTCTACPPEYVGSGETGCRALASTLSVVPGKLQPAFDPEVSEYRVRVPSFAQHVGVTVEVGAGVEAELSIEDELATLGEPWLSPKLAGPMQVDLALRTRSQARSDYRLMVQRSEAKEIAFKAAVSGSGDQFGGYLAAYGNTLVVGAPYEKGSSPDKPDGGPADKPNAGAVYVYVRDQTGWRQQGYLKAKTVQAQDFFGSSVTIWKDRIVVGAPGNIFNSIASGASNGMIHVFERRGDTWAHSEALGSGNNIANGDSFGFRVALQENTLLVGAPLDDSGGTRSGATYVYGWDGESWQQKQRLKAEPPVAESRFGSVVRLDRDVAVVGAFAEEHSGARRAGAAYAYALGAKGWSLVQRLVAPTPREYAQFGATIALEGNTVVVTAPHNPLEVSSTHSGEAHVFQHDGAMYQRVQALTAMSPKTGDQFGSGIALRGGLLIIGSPVEATETAPHGALYLFEQGSQGFATSTIFAPTTLEQDDLFGYDAVFGEDFAASSAPSSDSRAQGVNADVSDNDVRDSGAVYVFQ